MNLTKIVLLVLFAVVGWKIVRPMLIKEFDTTSPTGSPNGGATVTEQPDVFSSVTNAVASIFGAVQTIAQTQPQSH